MTVHDFPALPLAGFSPSERRYLAYLAVHKLCDIHGSPHLVIRFLMAGEPGSWSKSTGEQFKAFQAEAEAYEQQRKSQMTAGETA